MKWSLKKVLFFGLLVGLIVAVWQWRAILSFYMDFSVRRVTKSLPKCDRIEIFHLTGNEPDGLIAVDASNGFPIRPYNNYARIRGQTTLAGVDATAFASLWRAQTFGRNYQALCHQPAYGFRYYSGSKLIYETSICFKCSNFYYPIFGDAGWHGFDTESTKAKEYLAKLQELFPDSVPLSKADARPSESLIASMKRAKDSVKAGDLAGGTLQQREILRDTLAGIDP